MAAIKRTKLSILSEVTEERFEGLLNVVERSVNDLQIRTSLSTRIDDALVDDTGSETLTSGRDGSVCLDIGGTKESTCFS